MANQLIFTSSVRGIKPGASGYCTVLRSPGIRPALEQALEKISLFEHCKSNQGRTIFTYRKLEIRGRVYYTLSRISDAGKDYTGRTNFLAHHLVLTQEELPDASPADLLLQWPHWCSHWEGDPGEEPVNTGSITQINALKPPVEIWRTLRVGIDGAANLASKIESKATLRSRTCSDEELVRLIGEALAVRAKFKKSYADVWSATFTVGLAVPSSVASFKWQALRASDDYGLALHGSLIDIDATMSVSSSVNEEILAIARDGNFRPPPKPVPLAQSSAAAGRGIPLQQGAVVQRIPRGPEVRLKPGSNMAPGHISSRSHKTPSKKKLILALATPAIALLVIFGVLFHQNQRNVSTLNYEKQLNYMLEMDGRRQAGNPPSDEEMEAVFRRLYRAANQSEETQSTADMLNSMNEIDWGITTLDHDESYKNNAKEAFARLHKSLSNKVRIEGQTENSLEVAYAEPILGTEVQESGDDARQPNVGTNPDRLEEVVSKPELLDLNDFKEIELRIAEEKWALKTTSKQNILKIGMKVLSINSSMDTLVDSAFSDLELITSLRIPGSRPALGAESAIRKEMTDNVVLIAPDSIEKELLLFVGESWPPTGMIIGELSFPDSTAEQAFNSLQDRVDPGEHAIVILDENNNEFQPLDLQEKQAGGVPGAGSGNTRHPLIEVMAKDAGADQDLPNMIKLFEKWVCEEWIMKKLEDLISQTSTSKLDEDEAKKSNELLKKAYANIQSEIKKNGFTIKSYFDAFNKEIKRLSDKKNEESNSSGRAPYEQAITFMINKNYPDGKLEKNIKEGDSTSGRTYTLTWRNDDDDWEIEYKDESKQFEVRSPKSKNDLVALLNDYINYKKNEQAREAELKAQRETLVEFAEVQRKWKSIQFKHLRSGKVTATINIK